MLDFPQPFGPTTAHMLLGSVTRVGSTNDLKPAREIDFKRIYSRIPALQRATALLLKTLDVVYLQREANTICKTHLIERLREVRSQQSLCRAPKLLATPP